MALAPGTRLGPYEILDPLGAGGMGEVYRARDSRLGRDVAIKVLPEHLAGDPQALERFEREARAIAALSHPNIVALFDVGSDQGISYTVTELLEGENLRAGLARGLMNWRRAVEIGAGIADGLSAAHSKGIIHRDLKPENIFLTTDGRTKVLDFGIARRVTVSGSGSNAPTQTAAGTLLGTVGYMSPEQVRGEPAEAPSDIFSFGCVLYEMVTGRRAFTHPTSAETMTAILKEEPPQAADSVKGLPAELNRLIVRTLEKSPQRRLQSARDLAASLRDLAAADTSRRAALPMARLSRRALGLAALALVAVIAGVLLTVWLLWREEPIDSLAVLPFVNAGGDPNMEYLSDGIAENLINGLSRFPGLRVVPRSRAFRYKGRTVDSQKAGEELNVRAVLTGRVLQRGDLLNIQVELVDVLRDSQLWGSQFDRKLAEIMTVQEEITREVSTRLKLRPSEEAQRGLTRRFTENNEAYQLYLKGRYYWNRRTEQTLQRARDYFQQAIDKDPGYALAWSGLADCYALFAGYMVTPPRESYARAKDAARKALQIDDRLAEPHAALGLSLSLYDWDWPAADQAYRRAIELNPQYATAHHWYAIYWQMIGRAEESIAQVRLAMQLEPLSLIINSELGRSLYLARRYDESIEQLRKTVELDPGFFRARLYLGWAYEVKGRHADAIAEFQQTLKQSPENPQLIASLGHAHAISGRAGEARKSLAELEALSRRRYVAPLDLALVHIGLGDKDRAFEWLDKAVEDHSSWLRMMKLDPKMDSLRNDPRFPALLRRMNLAP